MTAPQTGTAGVVAPPPLLFGGPLLATLALHAVRPLPLPLAAPVRHGFAALLLAGAALLAAPAILAFWRARTHVLPHRPSTALVVTGPYRVTRNPMYLGLTAVYLATTLLVGSWWPLLALPIVLAVVDRGVIAREERYLAGLFGADYAAYRQRVRRWL